MIEFNRTTYQFLLPFFYYKDNMFLSINSRKKFYTEDEIARMLLASDSENDEDLDDMEEIVSFQNVKFKRIGDSKISYEDEINQIGTVQYQEEESNNIQISNIPANDRATHMSENLINMPIIFEDQLPDVLVQEEITTEDMYLSNTDVEEQVQETTDNEPVVLEYDPISDEQFESSIIRDLPHTKRNDIQWQRGCPDKQEFVSNSLSFEENIDCDPNIPSPLEYFHRYIPKDFFETLSFYTNMYATQKDVPNWKATHAAEIEILFGLHMAMGNIKFSQLHMYWGNDFPMPLFSESMTKKRFSSLRNNLHMIDNLSRPKDDTDRLFKVRPIIESVRKRCRELIPEKILSVDEQIIPLRAKFNIKQYVKGKCLIKIFILYFSSMLFLNFKVLSSTPVGGF